jgi:hypothetical protein
MMSGGFVSHDTYIALQNASKLYVPWSELSSSKVGGGT